MPNRRCLLSFAITLLPIAAPAQDKPIPVRTVKIAAVSNESFAATPGIRQLPNGRVLVNDQPGRRLLVFDSTLTSFTIAADSAGTNGSPYPRSVLRSPMLAYPGDSALMVDFDAHTLLLIGPDGKTARAMAAPRSDDLIKLLSGTTGTDAQGRLFYRGDGRPSAKPGDPPDASTRDTIAVLRADFDTRKVDTIALFGAPRFAGNPLATDVNGKRSATLRVNPIPAVSDEWAVMTDGTIAIVREHDYHVDWIANDGKLSSTPKLPLAWRRLTDDDKRARIDSAKKVIDSLASIGKPYGLFRVVSRLPDGSVKRDSIIPTITYASLADITDYVPPIRAGAAQADADNHLWILPTTSAQPGAGLLYDVVNRKGELFERVRLPIDCVLTGFGKGGMLYLSRTTNNGKSWTLLHAQVLP